MARRSAGTPRVNRLIKFASVAVIVACGTVFGISPAYAFTTSIPNGTWAGTVLTGRTVADVKGELRVPVLNCAKGNGVGASWVGIDGANNWVVEQEGVTYGCSGGKQWDDAWYENYPAAAVRTPIAVYPHDLIWLVETSYGHTYRYSYQDVTRPGSYAVTTSAPYSQDRSGEWITEYLGLPFPHGATPTGQVGVYWGGGYINGSIPMGATSENWYIPRKTATLELSSTGAVTVVNPG